MTQLLFGKPNIIIGFFLISSVLIPTFICGLWGDYRGGFYYAVITRLVVIHHSTFFINSVAHFIGDQPFSNHNNSFDSFITALLTVGEGYHNFHHEFPQDYRCNPQFYKFDPIKWFIKGFSIFGLTYDLITANENEINKAQIQMQQRYLDDTKAKIEFGNEIENLPVWKQEDVNKQIQIGRNLILVEGYVLDIGRFVDAHPGGRLILLNEIGKTNEETTKNFDTKNNHSLKALAWMKNLRIAKLKCKII